MDGNDRELRVDSAHSATDSDMPEAAAYWQIWRMTQSPDYDPDQLVPLILKHSQIAERLLRVANSTAAGIKREIKNVRHAMLMIGSRGVSEFARPQATQYASTQEGRVIRTDVADTNALRGPAMRSAIRDAAEDPRR